MSDDSKEISSLELNDFIKVFIKNWKRICFLSASTIIITFSITLLMPKWYKSTVVLIIPDKTGSPLDLITGGVGALGTSVLGIGKSGNERYMAILDSRRIVESLVVEYNLDSIFKKDNFEETVKFTKTLIESETDKKNGTIKITFEYLEDPVKTAEMANFIAKKVDEINRELSTEQAKSTRLFIERRYTQAKHDLKESEDSLNFFQKKYGIIEISKQTEASIKAISEIYAQIISAETEYNVMKKSLGENHPELMRVESKIKELRKTQNQMEIGGAHFDALIPFNKTPDLGLQYFRLYRDVQINVKILEFLVPQYEQAKIQEARDTPTLLILDEAKPALRHSSPKKLTLSLISGLLSFFVVLVWLVMGERITIYIRSYNK